MFYQAKGGNRYATLIAVRLFFVDMGTIPKTTTKHD